MIVKVRMGDFYPRIEHGTPTEEGRRCHILGARVVELQGGLGVAEVGARNRDADGTYQGLDHIERAAEEIRKRLPEERKTANELRTRAKQLQEIVQPFNVGWGGDGKLPKNVADAVSDQVKAMGDHDLTIEGSSIASCGGMPSYIHTAKKRPGKLPPIPKPLADVLAKKRADKKQAEAKRISDQKKAYARYMADKKKKRANR